MLFQASLSSDGTTKTCSYPIVGNVIHTHQMSQECRLESVFEGVLRPFWHTTNNALSIPLGHDLPLLHVIPTHDDNVLHSPGVFLHSTTDHILSELAFYEALFTFVSTESPSAVFLPADTPKTIDGILHALNKTQKASELANCVLSGSMDWNALRSELEAATDCAYSGLTLTLTNPFKYLDALLDTSACDRTLEEIATVFDETTQLQILRPSEC